MLSLSAPLSIFTRCNFTLALIYLMGKIGCLLLFLRWLEPLNASILSIKCLIFGFWLVPLILFHFQICSEFILMFGKRGIVFDIPNHLNENISWCAFCRLIAIFSSPKSWNDFYLNAIWRSFQVKYGLFIPCQICSCHFSKISTSKIFENFNLLSIKETIWRNNKSIPCLWVINPGKPIPGKC